ncbi:(d)CMP kinase [Haladaptatus sp. DJG-WS-42]|uniref:(d)CMP kinase n=1 Tax=Haladaptatus sp. DJG-WS-42 TaxID=3120516 RepID=UPI0030CAEC36
MLITVSGPAGSGKSTTAKALAESLGYEHISGGDLFRSLAAERGLTPLELNKQAEEDEQIDRDLDRRLRDIARENDDVVLESRLAGWLAGEYADLRLWLDAPLHVRAARIADREGKPVEQARKETRARSSSEAQRYQAYYGIDITNLSIYDLNVNTARWSPESALAIVRTAAEEYTAADDEGTVEITIDYQF